MKKSLSDVNNGFDIKDLKIIFDDVPDFDEPDIIIANLINWQPLYDLYIIDNEVVLTIEIAGVGIKDFSIYVGKNYVVIDGIRRSPKIFTRECCVFHNIEIPYGRFKRRIDFPVPVAPRNYRYKIDNGILTLSFPILKKKTIPVEDG